MTNAFLQIPLNDESKEITTINTIWGLFHYNFLPFGLNISPGIFQQTMDAIIKDLKGVKSYQDDLLVYGRTKEEHDQRLLKLLERLSDYNVKINSKKSIFGVNQVTWDMSLNAMESHQMLNV